MLKKYLLQKRKNIRKDESFGRKQERKIEKKDVKLY